MAGELVFRLFDAARYQQLLPCLDELRSTRELSDFSIVEIRSLLDQMQKPIARSATGCEALERILRSRSLAPRMFLRPRELNEAITALVEASCFEDGARYSLVERAGDSWAVLECAVGIQRISTWASGEVPGVTPSRYPRGETLMFIVPHEFLPDLISDLTAARPAATAVDPRSSEARGEIEGLLSLARRAQASPKRLGLAFCSLL